MLGHLFRDTHVSLSQRNTSLKTILSTSMTFSAFNSDSLRNLPYSPSSTVISVSNVSSTSLKNTYCSQSPCSYLRKNLMLRVHNRVPPVPLETVQLPGSHHLRSVRRRCRTCLA